MFVEPLIQPRLRSFLEHIFRKSYQRRYVQRLANFESQRIGTKLINAKNEPAIPPIMIPLVLLQLTNKKSQWICQILLTNIISAILHLFVYKLSASTQLWLACADHEWKLYTFIIWLARSWSISYGKRTIIHISSILFNRKYDNTHQEHQFV